MLPRTRTGKPDPRRAAANERQPARWIEYTDPHGLDCGYWHRPWGETPTNMVVHYWIELIQLPRESGESFKLNSLSYRGDRFFHYSWEMARAIRSTNGRLRYVEVENDEQCRKWGPGGFGPSTYSRQHDLVRALDQSNVTWEYTPTTDEYRGREYARRAKLRREALALIVKSIREPISVNHFAARTIMHLLAGSHAPNAGRWLVWDTTNATIKSPTGVELTILKRTLDEELLRCLQGNDTWVTQVCRVLQSVI